MPADPGVPRRGKPDDLPAHLQGSLIGCIKPVNYLHERALASAVLAHQGVNLAWPQVEVHVLHGSHTTEAFGDVPEPEDSRYLSSRSSLSCAGIVR